MDCLIQGETLHKLRTYQIYSIAKEKTQSLLVTKTLRVIATESRNQEAGRSRTESTSDSTLYLSQEYGLKNTVTAIEGARMPAPSCSWQLLLKNDS